MGTSSDFELLPTVKYYSANREYYVSFESSGYLVLRNANSPEEPVWKSPLPASPQRYSGNTCILEGNGNIIILNSEKKPLWANINQPLQVGYITLPNCILDFFLTSFFTGL